MVFAVGDGGGGLTGGLAAIEFLVSSLPAIFSVSGIRMSRLREFFEFLTSWPYISHNYMSFLSF